jgi:hypothetical protein
MADINDIIKNLPQEALTPAAAEALGRDVNPNEQGITEPPVEKTDAQPEDTPKPEDVNEEVSPTPTLGGQRTFKRKGGKRKQRRRKTHKKKRRSHKRR